tara:strand:- start:138 stop:398 length:261 start_codon:yes stop_codon:yes gene_type:complete
MGERFDYGKEVANPSFLTGDSDPERAIRREIWVTKAYNNYEKWEREFMFDENNKEAKNELKRIKERNDYVERLYQELSKRDSWNLV